MRHLVCVLGLAGILAVSLLPIAPASAGDLVAQGYGGVNRDPSNGLGVYNDRNRIFSGRDKVNEMNPVYVPGQSCCPQPQPSPVWVPGTWAWNGFGWVWVPGYWAWQP